MKLMLRIAGLCIALLSLPAFGQVPVTAPEEAGFSSEKLGKIVPALQKFVDDQQVSGVITMVARRGKVVHASAVGLRDIDDKAPMQHDTICRIYSMSKPVTSVAVMLLYEDGQLDLDDPVSKYLPELAGPKVFVRNGDNGLETEPVQREMTVRDLLRHTSGLTYGLFGSTPIDQEYNRAGVIAPTNTLSDMMKKLGKLPLLYQPGTRFNYSVSSDVLGRLVEVVSGQSLDVFFSERIFKPLKMADTGFFVPNEKADRFASNYGSSLVGNGLRVVDSRTNSPFRSKPTLLSGGGGLVSTAPDYMRFCLMLAGRGEVDGVRLLRPETVAMMSKNQLPPDAYPIQIAGNRRQGVGFGLGFSVIVEQLEIAPYVPIGEYGWGGAASTHFWISPKHELAVVVLTQYMPFSLRLEAAVKPIVYEAIVN